MALSAEERLKIKDAYSKEWKKYQRRLKYAESKGFVIPESQRLKKVKNPQSWSTVNKLKKVTFDTIKLSSKREGTGFYINEETGEIVSKKEATSTIKTEPVIPPLSRTISRRDPNRPLSFNEYTKLAKKIESLRTSGQLNKDYDSTIFGVINEMRGKNFDVSDFLYQEEKSGGYLGSDPNRPLDEKEKSYINLIMKSRGWDVDDEYSYQKTVESLRGIIPEYDPEYQMWNEENQDESAYTAIDISSNGESQQSPIYDTLERSGEMPSTTKKGTTISSQLVDTYALDSFYNMISELTFRSPFAERNRDYLLRELSRLSSNPSQRKALNKAVKELAGEDGSVFDIDLMYKTGALAAYIYKLERVMIAFTAFDSQEELEKAQDEAEAALEESQDNITESDIY